MTENSQGVSASEGDGLPSTSNDEQELARYRTIVDTVGDGVYQLDRAGRFVSVNDVITEVTGYTREELLGEHVSLVLDERDIDTVEADIQDLLDTDQNGVRTRELTVHTADGSTLPAETRFSLFKPDDEVEGTVGVVRDISHRYEHQRAYRRERDIVERIFEAVSVSVAVVDEGGEIIRANERARDQLGIELRDGEPATVGDREIYDADGEFVPPGKRPYIQAFETGEPVRDWECQIELPDRGRRWLSVTAIPLRPDQAERGVEQVVVTADDITRTKRQAEQLRRQRDEFASELDEVFERMDDAFYAVDEEFCVTYVNRRAEELLQHAEDELLGRRLWDEVPEDAGIPAKERFHEALETQEPTSFEGYVDTLDRWIESTVYPSESGLSVYFRDVTERKEREQELERYETIVETVTDGIYTVDEDGHFTLVNESYADMLGYDRTELLGAHVSLVVSEETIEEAQGVERRLRTGDIDTATIETELQRADGTQIPAEGTFALLPPEAGNERVAVVRDTSERKRREQQLRRERDRLTALFETVPEAIVRVRFDDGDPVIQAVNSEFEDVFGYPREELVGMSLNEYIVPDEYEAEAARIDEATTSLDRIEQEVLRQTAGGNREFLFRGVPFESEGDHVEGVGVYIDITDRKRRERELERYEKLVEESADVNAILTPDGRFQHLTPSAVHVLGYEPADLVGEDAFEYIHPEDREETMERFAETVEEEGGRPTAEFRFRHADGSWRWLEARGRNLLDDPHIEGIVAYTRDITERKHHERELEESERRYRTLIENFPNGAVALLDEELHYTAIGGTPLESTITDLEGQSLQEGISSDLADVLVPRYRAAFDGETSSFELTYDGRTYQLQILPVSTDDGEIFAALGMSQDITERKEREWALEEYETIVETIPDGVYVLDEDHRFAMVNDALCEMTGFDRDELLGANARIMSTDKGHERGMELREQVRAGELDVAVLEEVIQTAAGEPFDGEIRFVRLSDDDGTFRGTAGVIRDISDRLERERELERQREQLAALNELNGVVREINETVIDRSTRKEIEGMACTQLAASDSYEYAWIGEVESHDDTIQVRTHAGSPDYVEDLTLSIDPDDRSGDGPTSRALRTGDMQVVQDIGQDADPEPWHDRAVESGFRAVAAIPISYEGTLYGVLSVYADRPNAFDQAEREVIDQLGEVIGHAINAIERKQALMSDDVVELEFHVRNILDEFDIPEPEAGQITFDRAVPLGDDEFLEFGTATDGAIETLEAIVDNVPHFADLVILNEMGDTVRYELTLDEPPVLSAVAAHGGRVENAVIQDGDWRMTIEVPPSVGARRITDIVKDAYSGAEVVAQRQTTRPDRSGERLHNVMTEELTDRQRTALETAYYAGFFDWPRESTGEDIAETMNVAPATFHQHLRVGQNKLLGALFGEAVATA